MARNKPRAKKLRLIKAGKSCVSAPFWALIKAMGRRRTHSWRLNPHKRRHWRKNRLKV